MPLGTLKFPQGGLHTNGSGQLKEQERALHFEDLLSGPLQPVLILHIAMGQEHRIPTNVIQWVPFCSPALDTMQ